MRGAKFLAIVLSAASLFAFSACLKEAGPSGDGPGNGASTPGTVEEDPAVPDVEASIAALQTGEIESRREAAEALCFMKGHEAEILKEVKPLLDSESPLTREASCYAFG